MDPTDPEELQDTIYQALASSERRAVLRYLSDGNSPITDRRLAAELADSSGAPAVEDSEAREQSVLVGLRHVHLPKLEAAGLIERDDAGLVERSPLLDRLSVTTPLEGGPPDVSVTPRERVED